MMECPKCGYALSPFEKTCPRCELLNQLGATQSLNKVGVKRQSGGTVSKNYKGKYLSTTFALTVLVALAIIGVFVWKFPVDKISPSPNASTSLKNPPRSPHTSNTTASPASLKSSIDDERFKNRQEMERQLQQQEQAKQKWIQQQGQAQELARKQWEQAQELARKQWEQAQKVFFLLQSGEQSIQKENGNGGDTVWTLFITIVNNTSQEFVFPYSNLMFDDYSSSMLLPTVLRTEGTMGRNFSMWTEVLKNVTIPPHTKQNVTLTAWNNSKNTSHKPISSY